MARPQYVARESDVMPDRARLTIRAVQRARPESPEYGRAGRLGPLRAAVAGIRDLGRAANVVAWSTICSRLY
jgi:hypothetical protein